MGEFVTMFKSPAMIKTAALTAALFALLAAGLKNGIVIIPEAMELRVANMLSVVCGLWFGPAGAVGCAMGNFVGDLGGTLSWYSLPGFVANFLYGYLPYKLWAAWGAKLGEAADTRPSAKARLGSLRYFTACLLGAFVCAVIVAAALAVKTPAIFLPSFRMIFLNDLIVSAIPGYLLFLLLPLLPARLLPYWREKP